jgi:hypothetical protein
MKLPLVGDGVEHPRRVIRILASPMPLTLETVARLALPTVGAGRALAERERRTLERVIEVFLEGTPVDVTTTRAADNVERFLVTGRSRRAWRVRVLLTLIELSTLAEERRRFSDLTLEQRRRVVGSWTARGRVRRICGRVRNLAILGIYGDTRAAGATGYVPVPLRVRFREGRTTHGATA